jgi:hypothetical protein
MLDVAVEGKPPASAFGVFLRAESAANGETVFDRADVDDSPRRPSPEAAKEDAAKE